MNVAVFQSDIVWQQPLANCRKVEEQLASLQGVDLCLLPEMWTTGFVVSPDDAAEAEGTTLLWMRQQSRKYGIALCGTVAVCVADDTATGTRRFYNRMYFTSPDGTTYTYDKRHLFGMGGEKAAYTSGNRRVIAEYKGWRFLLLTCYDLRFPVWMRNRNDYDAILIAANWPAPRRRVWDILLQARAIENQCFVVAANRTGADPMAQYNGGSCIIDPKGKVIACADDNTEHTITAQISAEDKQNFISRFNTLEDADGFRLL